MKRLRLLAALLAAAALAEAPGVHAGVALGVRGGLSVSGISGDDPPAPRSKLGIGVGSFLTIGLSDRFTLQPEVLFVSKGASWGESEATDANGSIIGTTETLTVLDYIEIPVLLRWSLPVGGALRPVLFAGPAAAFEVGERMALTGALERDEDTDALEDFDVGAAAGAGVEMIGFGGIWSLEGRYTAGLRSLAKDGSAWQDPRNWNVLVTIGFARAVW